jgi:lipid IVA palmitoyltransferase
MLCSIPHRTRCRQVLYGTILILIVSSAMPRAWSAPLNFGAMLSNKLSTMSHTVRMGEWETYLTGYAWHLPYSYQDPTRTRLNETTWGGGFGRTLSDDDGDRHSVYFMAFADSHRSPQFNLGYGWQRYWNATRQLSLGAGYLAFLFSREDVANHLPLPALLPCLSIRYLGLELIGLFVPRVSREIKGDVLFVYLRFPFGDERRRESRLVRK